MIRRSLRHRRAGLLLTGLAVINLHFKAMAEEKDENANLSQIIAGAAISGGTAASIGFTYLKMRGIYAQASLAELATETDASGLKMDSRQIQDLTRKIKSGDAVHITYMSSEAEQRNIEVSQTKAQHDQLLRRQHQMQLQLHASSGDQALILASEVRDLAKMVDASELRLRELQAQTVKTTPKPAVRIFDMSEARTPDVEDFLLNKIKDGRRIIKVERVDQRKRSSFRHMRIVMGGQLVLATLSGLMVMEEVFESRSDSKDAVKGSSLYTPVLESPIL